MVLIVVVDVVVVLVVVVAVVIGVALVIVIMVLVVIVEGVMDMVRVVIVVGVVFMVGVVGIGNGSANVTNGHYCGGSGSVKDSCSRSDTDSGNHNVSCSASLITKYSPGGCSSRISTKNANARALVNI